MAQSDVECANIALTKIGAPKITALSDSVETAIACNLCIDPLRKALLSMHPWNVAVKRTNLSPTVTAISNAADNGSGEIRITSTTHGLVTGDRATVENVDGVPANGTWFVTRIDANNVDLDDSVFSGTYTASSTDQITKAPAFLFTYQVALPSDWIRTLRVNELTGADYRMEGGYILTDDYPVELKYVYDVTTYTAMDVEFYQLLALGLAAQICYKITQSSTKEAQLQDEFKRMQSKIRFDDATEDPAEIIGADDWTNSRFTLNLPTSTTC